MVVGENNTSLDELNTTIMLMNYTPSVIFKPLLELTNDPLVILLNFSRNVITSNLTQQNLNISISDINASDYNWTLAK